MAAGAHAAEATATVNKGFAIVTSHHSKRKLAPHVRGAGHNTKIMISSIKSPRVPTHGRILGSETVEPLRYYTAYAVVLTKYCLNGSNSTTALGV